MTRSIERHRRGTHDYPGEKAEGAPLRGEANQSVHTRSHHGTISNQTHTRTNSKKNNTTMKGRIQPSLKYDNSPR